MTDRVQIHELDSESGEEEEEAEEEEEEELLWVDAEDLERPPEAEYIEIDLGNNKEETEEPLGKKHKRAASTKRGVRLLFDKHDITRSTGYHWSHIEQAVAAGCTISRLSAETSIISAVTALLPHSLAAGCNETQFRSWDGSRRSAFLLSIQQWFRSNFQELSGDDFGGGGRDLDGTLNASPDPNASPGLGLQVENLLRTLRSSPLAATRAQICALCMAALQAFGVECRLVCAIDPPSWRPQQHWSLYKAAWQRGFQEHMRAKTSTDGSAGKDKHSGLKARASAAAAKRARHVRELVYAVSGPAAEPPPPALPSQAGSAVDTSHHSHSVLASEEDALAQQRQQWHRKNRSLAKGTAYWLEVYFPAHSAGNGDGGSGSNLANRWVHMDPLVGLDAPLQVEAKQRTTGGKFQALQYVCAVDPAGRAVDVSRKYASRPELSASLTNAGLQQLWAALLQQRTDDAEALIIAANAETENGVGAKAGHADQAANSRPSFAGAGQVVISLIDSEETDDANCAAIEANSRVPMRAPSLGPALATTSRTSGSNPNTFNAQVPVPVSSAVRVETSQVFSQRRLEEAAQIKQAASKAPKPTTLAGYKNHPDYVLNCDGHMRASEVLLPNARPIGLFKGHAIYRREDVTLALSKKNWRKLHMRDVLPEQADSPVCTQSRTDGRGASGGGGARGDKKGAAASSAERFDVPLYGIWQTRALCVDPVKDGVIPVNSHGNVEVWDFQESLVPRGSRLIPAKDCDLAAVRTLCADMQIPCVSAVVGFERSSSAAQPIIGGVVVLEEHYDMLRDAASDLAAQERAQAALRREAHAMQWWASIVQRALTRSRLKTTYGH